MRIDLIFLLPLIVLFIMVLATYFQKLNMWVAFLGVVIAFGITYWIAPFQELVLMPLANSLWYGYTWGVFEIIVAIYVITLFVMVGVAVYNLYMTGGKKLWT